MNKATLQLFNKEWHEQRWKLAFGCVILMGFAAIGLRTRLIDDRSILLIAVVIGAFILPLFIGMGVVASDRAEGSLATLLALPIRPLVVLAVKLAVGLAACLAPLAGVGLATWVFAGQREMAASDAAQLLALGAAAGAMVMLWTVTLGVRQTTEARAALLGMTFLALGFAVVIFGNLEMVRISGADYWLKRVCLVHPTALFWLPPSYNNDDIRSWTQAVVQVVVAVILCAVAIRRLNPASGGRR